MTYIDLAMLELQAYLVILLSLLGTATDSLLARLVELGILSQVRMCSNTASDGRFSRP